MRNDELVINLRLPRWTIKRWLIVGAVMAVSEVALAAPRLTDGVTLKAADLNALAAGTVPSGAVMYFNLQACPVGWTEQVTAQGRYLVGLPVGGTLFGTDGTPLTDKEDRPVGQHTHALTDPGHAHGYYSVGGGNDPVSGGGTSGKQRSTDTSTTGITLSSSGAVAATNAPYLQLLVCQKN